MADTVLLSRTTSLQHVNKIVKKSAINIEFEDVKFSVNDFTMKKNNCKQILNSVSGKFRCGELTAILGPSGAGKTTLLNVLAGYVKKGVQGNIKINGDSRSLSTFSKLSSYIMHENSIHPHLSVREAVIYAVRFKLPSTIKHKDKIAIAEEVIKFLGLYDCRNTRSEFLSGGEKKKLTIAVELVYNPSVIFLDEPTTGLDDFALKQCIDLLKRISQLNRTVICTIHQPSSLIFHCFDQVYVMADGYCVYNGSPTQLVPFFCSTGYPCPPNYNPADYIIELVHSDSSVVDCLKTAIRNGKINMKEYDQDIVEGVILNKDKKFPTSFTGQLNLLLSRMFLKTMRNKLALLLQFFAHILSGLVMGALFSGVGSNASEALSILMMCHCTNMFMSFTYSIIPVLTFPSEILLLKREYFNTWYRLKAYCVAQMIVNSVLLVFFGTIFITILYVLSNQPMENDHYVGVLLINLMIGLNAQAMGHIFGTIFDNTTGVLMNFVTLSCMTLLGIYGLGYKAQLSPLFKFLTTISYIRHGTLGMGRALSYNRRPLICNEVYCHYTRMELFFKDSNIVLSHYIYDFGILCIFFLVLQTLSYLVLKCRLNYQFVSKIQHFVKRIVK